MEGHSSESAQTEVSSKRLAKERGHVAAWGWSLAVLLAGLTATVVAARWAWRDAVELDRARFHQSVDSIKEAFETKAEIYEFALGALREWVQTEQVPNLKDWRNRIERMNLGLYFGAIVEVGFMPYVINSNLERWKDRIPSHWTNIWPELSENTRDNYRIANSSTSARWGVSRLGQRLDATFWSEAYANAYSRGDMKTSGRIMVTPQVAGFRALLATYHTASLPELPPTGIHQGSNMRSFILGNALAGMVFADVAVDSLVESVFGKTPRAVDFDLYAGRVYETNRLTRLDRVALVSNPALVGQWTTTNEFAWYGQKWSFACSTTPLFWRTSLKPRALELGIGGCVLSIALSVLVFVQVRARMAAEAFSNELEQSREQIQRADEARARLSRDLHDGTVQSIYVVGLGLQQAKNQLQNHTEASELVRKAIRDLDGVISDLRRFLRSHAESSTALSLGDAVQELAQRWQRSSGTVFEVRLPEASLKSVPARLTLELLAITQECVSNSLRHGAASQVDIQITLEQGWLELCVRDNGVGFDVEHAATGLGLANIRARAQALGGECSIVSTPGASTHVCVRVQLE